MRPPELQQVLSTHVPGPPIIIPLFLCWLHESHLLIREGEGKGEGEEEEEQKGDHLEVSHQINS